MCEFDVLRECKNVNRAGKAQEFIPKHKFLTKTEVMLFSVLESVLVCRKGIKNKWKYEETIKLLDQMSKEERKGVAEKDMWKHYCKWMEPTKLTATKGDLRSDKDNEPKIATYAKWMTEAKAKQQQIQMARQKRLNNTNTNRGGMNQSYGFSNSLLDQQMKTKA